MDFIDPINDSRVSHCYADLHGKKYRMITVFRPSPVNTKTSNQTTSSAFRLEDIRKRCSWYSSFVSCVQ